MTWRRAPLYISVHDLSHWLLSHVEVWPAGAHATLRAEIAAAQFELLGAVTCALTFPASRAADCERADRRVAQLRVLLRLAVELGRTSAAQARHAAAELDAIGRMLGGWRRAGRVRAARSGKNQGARAQAAPTA